MRRVILPHTTHIPTAGLVRLPVGVDQIGLVDPDEVAGAAVGQARPEVVAVAPQEAHQERLRRPKARDQSSI